MIHLPLPLNLDGRETETETKTGMETETEIETETETEIETETETEIETEIMVEAETETEAEAQTEAGAEIRVIGKEKTEQGMEGESLIQVMTAGHIVHLVAMGMPETAELRRRTHISERVVVLVGMTEGDINTTLVDYLI